MSSDAADPPFDGVEPVGDFEAFVRANARSLLGTARLLTGDSSSAEDLVQDTLCRLYSRWGRVVEADAPLAYVRRALINSFLNSRRARPVGSGRPISSPNCARCKTSPPR